MTEMERAAAGADSSWLSALGPPARQCPPLPTAPTRPRAAAGVCLAWGAAPSQHPDVPAKGVHGSRGDASVPNVQVTKLTLMCEQAPGPITMDLTGDLEVLQSRPFVLKEGVDYRVKVSFKVNREIVCGLKCLHLTYRRGRPVDRDVFMVGSYAPRAEEYEVVTPAEEVPRGRLVRGSYRVRSLVTDDDKTEHLSWEWGLCIKKAWED
nr:rho GDP-dissociation inhibitor 3 isoform X1 [Anser cygnoides]